MEYLNPQPKVVEIEASDLQVGDKIPYERQGHGGYWGWDEVSYVSCRGDSRRYLLTYMLKGTSWHRGPGKMLIIAR